MSTVQEPTDERAAYIAGLHELADFLSEHPDVPLPHLGTYLGDEYVNALYIYLLAGDDQRARLATIARAMGTASKSTSEDGARFRVHRRFAGLYLVVTADRDEVCTKTVVGTREVTVQVPDPEALAAVPKITVTKTVEDVEWRCESLLSEGGAS